MMRALIPIAVIGCVVALWLMQDETDAPKPNRQETVETAQRAEQTPTERRIARDRVANRVKMPEVSPSTPRNPLNDAAAPEPEAETPKAPEGPFEVDLGAHTIHLKDDARKRVARFNLVLVTQTDTTRVEIRRRRRELIRMTYFLGSKRQADGAVGDAGKRRFERDLQERFENVIRTGAIDSLSLKNYRIERRAADAGIEPE